MKSADGPEVDDEAEADQPAEVESPVREDHAGERDDDDVILLPDIRWLDVLCIGPVALWTLYRLFGTPWAASQIGPHPLLLTALRASYPSIITVGAHLATGIPLWLALVVPLPSLFIDDPFIYWAGRRYGRRMTEYLVATDPAWNRRIARTERAMRRFGMLTIVIANIPFVPIPVTLVYFLAGDSRMPIWKFVLADLFSLELEVIGLLALGRALGSHAITVADTVSRYSGYLTIVFFVALFGWGIWSTRKNMPAIEAQMRAHARADAERRRGPK